MNDQALPKVSFIIPTLNASYYLKMCLPAIRGQDYPQDKVEIVIADAYSKDDTRALAAQYGAKVIDNPEILHEPGKTRATQAATGDLLFFTDADNIPAHPGWLRSMVRPFVENENVTGLLPQTIAPPDSNALNRYLGHLFTDPFTWFVYGKAANPLDFKAVYTPVKETAEYQLFKFTPKRHPLFGLSQGVGTTARFNRGGTGSSDDILAGINLISEGGLVAYVPSAGIYHYHVDGYFHFLRKYRWRVQNNLTQKVKGMGIANRSKFMSRVRRFRMFLFIPYAFTLVFPLIDSVKLAWKFRDAVMFWHLPASVGLAWEIVTTAVRHRLGLLSSPKTYGV